MRWLPLFATGSATLAGLPDRDDDAEGRYFTVQWFGLVVEVTFARVRP